MPIGIKASVLGAEDLKRTLSNLEPKYFRPAARKGVDDGTKLVVEEARARVPERTKSLRKALGKKVVAFRNKQGYVGVAGPRKDPGPKQAARLAEAFAAGKRKSLPTAKYRRTVKYLDREILVNPVKYAHLVEFGRRAVAVTKKKVLSDGSVVFGKSVRSVPPHPFIRPAWTASEGRARAAIRSRLAEAAQKAARG